MVYSENPTQNNTETTRQNAGRSMNGSQNIFMDKR